MDKKKYSITIWKSDPNNGIFDTTKNVLLIDWSLKNKKQFDQSDVDNFFMMLKISAAPYDQPWVVDSVAFSSSEDFDISFFFVASENSIKMSIVSNNKKARNKLDKAIEYIENL